ncbi:MAG: hypothetical protein IKI45_06520 [Oscillospiraceae bacterium]|nr:hypothetical protein [Oscillospiraceae bacterium]
MSFYFYIEAKITEKATGRCITVPHTKDPWDDWFRDGDYAHEEYRYFSVLEICGRDSVALCQSWIDIINRYTKADWKFGDRFLPFPPSALREMCSCLFSYTMLPEDNRFLWWPETGYWDPVQREKEPPSAYAEPADNSPGWDHIVDAETSPFYLAQKLRNFIYQYESIHFENAFTPPESLRDTGLFDEDDVLRPEDFILREEDRIAFCKNPQAYEWAFWLNVCY